MAGFISDIKTAAQVFGDIRRGRKEGREIEVRRFRKVPFIVPGPAFLNTIEGCTLSNCGSDIFKRSQLAFAALSEEEKNRFLFVPKDGEFVERARFWKALLRPAMPPAQYRIAMTAILRWYIHIKRSRKSRTSYDVKGKVTL